MKDNFLHRLKQFIEYKGISNNKFAEEVGISSAQMSHMMNGINFGVDKLLIILSNYTELNSQWLMTGEGEMLKKKEKFTKKDNPVADPCPEEIIKIFVNQIHDQAKEIGRLEAELKQAKGNTGSDKDAEGASYAVAN